MQITPLIETKDFFINKLIASRKYMLQHKLIKVNEWDFMGMLKKGIGFRFVMVKRQIMTNKRMEINYLRGEFRDNYYCHQRHVGADLHRKRAKSRQTARMPKPR